MGCFRLVADMRRRTAFVTHLQGAAAAPKAATTLSHSLGSRFTGPRLAALVELRKLGFQRRRSMLGQYVFTRSFAHRIRAQTPPEGAYVFFNSRYLSAVARGTIKVQTASSFRTADGIAGGRSDPQEMTDIYRPGAGTRLLWHEDPLVARSGLNINPDRVRLQMYFDEHDVLRFEEEAYLFCMSTELTDEICTRMWHAFGHDMYYRVSDVVSFGNQIMLAEPRLQPIVFCKQVEYRESDETSLSWHPNRFLKRPEYAWQQELRFVWPAEASAEPILISAPAVLQFIEIRKNPAAARDRYC